MQILLYPSHHDLPFWSSTNPQNPMAVLEPEKLESWYWMKDRQERHPFEQHSMYPVLLGLASLDIPGVVAHVSINVDGATGEVGFIKRSWVQFSTVPKSIVDGIPQVIVDNQVQVRSLWKNDNATYSPYEFIDGYTSDRFHKGEFTPEFWANFFLTELHQYKKNAVQAAEEALQKAQFTSALYAVIPDA